MTEEFKSLAKAAARSLGYADLPMVIVPHPFEVLAEDVVERLAESKFQEILDKVVAS
ncbi:MAG: hypothetical protein ACKVQU_30145 [Burkholderiales bacterium]